MNPQNDLEKRIKALEDWKKQRETQQIVYPLDFQSQKILGNYFMHIIGDITTVGGAGGNTFVSYLGQQGPFEFTVDANIYIPYTVTSLADNQVTVAYGNFEDDEAVSVITSDTAPAPLVAGIVYYVINSTGQTFKLTTVQGDSGSIVDITDTGTGKQYIYFS